MQKTLFTFATVATLALTAIATHADTAQVSGTFKGASDHITTGQVTVVKTAGGGAVVILDEDFSLDGAPDPRVGFGVNGVYADASDLGELTKKEGLQVYIVPASVNVDDFNEIYIWCKQFAVPLGVATLS